MVFHTAPPHPASNARITCSPQLVGGALASQNGFSHRMPARFVVRSANLCLRSPAQPFRDPVCRAFAVRDRIHHLASAVHAIPAREVLGVRCLPGRALDDLATKILTSL